MKTAFIFPGQGSQKVGMGKEFIENFDVAKQVFEEVDDSLGVKLSQIILEGPAEELTSTINTQPALMATSIAILRVIEQETGKTIEQLCDFVAGHSLGEYTALAATGSITISDTARLLRLRGKSMQEAVPAGEGSMAAVLGASFKEVEEIAEEASEFGVCQIANDNCPGQQVLSGSLAAIERAVEIAKSKGKKSMQLPVSAPFHCRLMEPVANVMQEALANVGIESPKIPLVANFTAQACIDPAEIRKNLTAQVAGMVRWNDSMNFMTKQGAQKFVEVGAGKVLAGLCKRINPDLKAISINSPESVKELL